MSALPPFDTEPLASRPMLIVAGCLAALPLAGLWFGLSPAAAVATAYLAFVMTLITAIDLQHFIIPDLLSLPAIPVGLAANTIVFQGGDWAVGLQDGLLGAALGFGVFYGLRALYFRARGMEGLGLGDVKLATAAGAWLGLDLLAPASLASALAALAAVLLVALRRGESRVNLKAKLPFGSFIAPTTLLFWVWRLAENGPG